MSEGTRDRRAGGAVSGYIRSNVVGFVALFVALGGDAYAHHRNSVGPQQLQRDAVKKRHVERNAIAAKELRPNSVRPRQLAANAVRSPHILDGAVTADKLAPGVAVSGPQGERGPKGDPGEPGPTVAGAAATHRDFQTPLPSNGTQHTLLSLSDGSGLLQVPFPARLQVNAIAHLAKNSGGSTVAFCRIRLDDTPLGPRSRIFLADGSGGNTGPVATSVNVDPGTYDVSLVCASSGGNGWVDAAINVIAAPR